MTETSVGRLLTASLHQAIADLLPARLEFYEDWLHPAGLRDSRIGLAPLGAALSFLRRETLSYDLVTGRAGQYAAEWMVGDLRPIQRSVLRWVPPALRLRLVLRLARRMIRRTYAESRPSVRWRWGRATMAIPQSAFCGVRERVDAPLCEFYVAAVRRLLAMFALDADVRTERCRATGASDCAVGVLLRRTGGT
jgi:hypothetical protein